MADSPEVISVSRGRLAGQRGSAMIEYALVLSVFFLTVFGFIQICLVLFGFGNATYASRLATRYAIVHGSTSTNPCSAANLQSIITPLLWGAPSGGVTISATWSPDNSPGSTVTVKVAIQYNPKIPFFADRTFTVGTTARGTILK